jgi:hypothetical protein
MRRTVIIPLLLVAALAAASSQPSDATGGEQLPIVRQAIDTGLVVAGKYGFGQMLHVDLVESYAANRLVEVLAGWRNWQRLDELDIPGLRQTSLFYGFTESVDEPGKLPSTSSRFGFRTASGYGWGNSSGMLLPYTSSSMVWTQLRIDQGSLETFDRSVLRHFDDAYRFGHATEIGLELIAENGVAVSAGFDRTLVFRRHIFFKELLSTIIQDGVADAVAITSARMIRSRIASPIVSFILSSAVRFGVSQLRRQQMNWPFESDPPLLFDTFELGLAYTF